MERATNPTTSNRARGIACALLWLVVGALAAFVAVLGVAASASPGSRPRPPHAASASAARVTVPTTRRDERGAPTADTRVDGPACIARSEGADLRDAGLARVAMDPWAASPFATFGRCLCEDQVARAPWVLEAARVHAASFSSRVAQPRAPPAKG